MMVEHQLQEIIVKQPPPPTHFVLICNASKYIKSYWFSVFFINPITVLHLFWKEFLTIDKYNVFCWRFSGRIGIHSFHTSCVHGIKLTGRFYQIYLVEMMPLIQKPNWLKVKIIKKSQCICLRQIKNIEKNIKNSNDEFLKIHNWLIYIFIFCCV